MDIEKTFQNYLQKEALEKKRLLLMVSGGVDSMTLLYVAQKFVEPKKLAVLHVNHRTRVECEEEFNFVQKKCSGYGIRFFGKRINDVPEKNKEDSWRRTRVGFQSEVQKEFPFDRVLTAHHATDLVETMIFRLTKGCGVDGLSPFDVSTKPFWDIPKSEIIEYAKTQNIEWKEDFSNNNIIHERNRIRQNIIPELRKITPNLEKVFVRESVNFGEVAGFLSASVEKCHGASLRLDEFLQFHPAQKKQFLRSIAKKTPSASEVDDCLRWLKNNPPGNSEKEIGGAFLQIKSGEIFWT